MGDNENAVNIIVKATIESDMACCNAVDNQSKCCRGDAELIADNQLSDLTSNRKEGVSEKVGMPYEILTHSVSCETQGRNNEPTQQEGIDNESFTNSPDIETIHESCDLVDDQLSSTDQARYSVSDITTPVDLPHLSADQSMQLDEPCSPRDRLSYDSDDQVTIKSDNLTYSTKVASEQSTDSEGNEAGEGESESDNRGSRIMSSESECDTYNVQQHESHDAVSPHSSKEVSHLESDMENDNSLEDAEALINGGSVSPVRPQSLSLPQPVQCKEKPRRVKQGSESSSLSGYSCCSSTDALIEAAASVPLQGTITREGDMIAFVAEDLNSMIKMSSPISKTDDSSSASLSGKRTPRSASFGSVSSSASGWSVSASSASGWSYSAMSRSPSIVTQSPEDVPPIDPRVVDDLQVQANNVAENLRHMMGTLQNHMQKMSAVTYSCLDIYRESVDNTCNCVDSSIKSMYALMAKNEELARAMQPVNELHEQIKEINRLLDVFDLQMAREEK